MIKTGLKFFGLNVWLDSSGDADVDEAAKSVFHDHYTRTRPLTISTRPDVRVMLAWGRDKMVPRKNPDQPMFIRSGQCQLSPVEDAARCGSSSKAKRKNAGNAELSCRASSSRPHRTGTLFEGI